MPRDRWSTLARTTGVIGLTAVALVSGTLVAAYGVIDASWDAASNRGAVLDPNIAVYAFDLGNLGFANVWLAMASFAIAVGWVLHESRALPAWWGRWAMVSGLGLDHRPRRSPHPTPAARPMGWPPVSANHRIPEPSLAAAIRVMTCLGPCHVGSFLSRKLHSFSP